jgi:hypothetical protein
MKKKYQKKSPKIGDRGFLVWFVHLERYLATTPDTLQTRRADDSVWQG